MSTSYEYFLNRVIDDGVAEVRKAYANDEERHKMEGAIAGFEACRGKNPLQLKILLGVARAQAHDHADIKEYWRARYAELQVEWVANVLSAALQNEGRPPLASHLPTARGVMKAAEILGVATVQ